MVGWQSNTQAVSLREPRGYGYGCAGVSWAIITRRWAPEIILALSAAPKRFNRLLEIPGIYDKVLTERLRDLEQFGLVIRTVDIGPPVRVSYSLTDGGQKYIPALRALQEVAGIAS
jgi:DNA-binding HxlR family transcriptional regulator